MYGHLSIPKLLQLYIPRNLLHLEWAVQSSIMAFVCSNVSAVYIVEDLMFKVVHLCKHDRASLYVAITNEKTAVYIIAQEVAREYGLYMLSKLLLY